MKFDEYEDAICEFVQYPDENEIHYLALGLCGEAGETVEPIKKIYRKYARPDEKNWSEIQNEIGSELGDVLFYLTRLANAFGWSLQEIAAGNIGKLKERLLKDQIKTRG